MVNGDGEKPGASENTWVKVISKCPACGSEDRFFEGMGKELKARGLAKEEMHFFLELKSGPFANQEVMAKLPIGGEVPAYAMATDICVNCGCIYVVRLERLNVKKGLQPVQLQPNRAQRRAGAAPDGRGFRLPPQLNNPFLS